MLIFATILAQDTGVSTIPIQFVLAVLCVIVLSSIAVGVSWGLARRMQQIAERTPRKHLSPSPTDERNNQAPD